MSRSRLEKQFTYEGRLCSVWVHPHGFRCGYVNVGDASPLYGRSYDELANAVSIHGGLTFSGQVNELYAWCFGIDFAHAGDSPDPTTPEAQRTFEFDEWFSMMPTHGHIWTLEEVMDEVRSLSDQLAAIERELTA